MPAQGLTPELIQLILANNPGRNFTGGAPSPGLGNYIAPNLLGTQQSMWGPGKPLERSNWEGARRHMETLDLGPYKSPGAPSMSNAWTSDPLGRLWDVNFSPNYAPGTTKQSE